MFCVGDKIDLRNTYFQYATNFSGDPERSRYRDSRRLCNIVIPDEALARELSESNIKVGLSKPGPKDDPATFVPKYFIPVQAKYRKINGEPLTYQPRIYLVNDNGFPVLLDEETVGVIDNYRVTNVNALINIGRNSRDPNGYYSLFIECMYVEGREKRRIEDPYAALYNQADEPIPTPVPSM